MRSSTSSVILLVVAFLAVVNSVSAGGGRQLAEEQLVGVGQYQNITKLDDPHVVAIAKFAVDQYNAEAKKALVLTKVLHGQKQVVAGTNYRLDVEVRYGDADAAYEAVVFESLAGTDKLVSFTAINN